METLRGGGRGSRGLAEGEVELVVDEVRRAESFVSRSSSLGLRPLAVFQAAEPVSSTLLLKFLRASSNPQRLSGIVVVKLGSIRDVVQRMLLGALEGARVAVITDFRWAKRQDTVAYLSFQ